MDSSIKLYQGDCLEIMKDIPNQSIDCVITSPPYNVDLGNNKFNSSAYNSYADNKEHTEYINWLQECFSIIYDKLVCGGRVVINIGDGKNGAVPTSADIIHFMTHILKYLPLSHLIWDKQTTSNRAAWGSWLSPNSPSYPCPFEHILIFAKDTTTLQHNGETDLTPTEFKKYAYGIWQFPCETTMSKYHPAPFPVELPIRCIKMNTYINDTILDPFMGSGTTGVACKKLNRNFIGIELDPKYFELAKERIEKSTFQISLF